MAEQKSIQIKWHHDKSDMALDRSVLEVRGTQTLDLGIFGKYINPTVAWHVDLYLRRFASDGSAFGICSEASIRCQPLVDMAMSDQSGRKLIHARIKVQVFEEVDDEKKLQISFDDSDSPCFTFSHRESSLPHSTGLVPLHPNKLIHKFEVDPSVKKLHIVLSVSWRSNALLITNTREQIIRDRSKVIKNLKALLLSKKHTDVVFIVDSVEIPAHRSILAAMSQVFSCMFEHDTQDKRTGVIKVEDASPEGFKSMLRSIYTGSEPKWTTDENDLLELCYLAHKYELETLQDQCARRMVSVLKTDNVCHMLKAANVFSLSPVMDMIIAFLKNNKDVLHSDEWEKLQQESPSVVMNILRKLV